MIKLTSAHIHHFLFSYIGTSMQQYHADKRVFRYWTGHVDLGLENLSQRRVNFLDLSFITSRVGNKPEARGGANHEKICHLLQAE